MTTKENAKQKIVELIEKHQRHKNEGRFNKINEENTKDYLDELLRILGWDFTEDIIKEYGTGKRKRVDYAFQINGTTKFLLEAKAYNEELEDKYIKQTLEYGYQNNKTWVVLTNFKEIRVYNAKYYDKEEHIRRLFEPLRIEDAVVRFDDLWVLSKEGMKENLINQLANKYGKVKPKEAIDTLIFEDLMRWRKSLEKGIRDHERLNRLPTDPEAAEKYIDEAVQKILDRIIFVRVCEDRGLEEEELLRSCVRMWGDDKKHPLMDYINRLFSKKDGEYNSGLFQDHYSQNLSIDNPVLEKIIEESYVNQNGLTYNFSAIDADILGTIYENYLAYIQKRVRDKETKQKSKRKAQGIYYTPTYVVDYIVKNTLGEKLKECKKPEDALKIKVLDPSCGSGSFLIRAYDEFKQWFVNYQRGNGGEQTRLDLDSEKGMQTFMDQVLENCIYGVDLDAKAIEIAQLNLLLKSAEGKHKLPTLNHTIQCGNSLIDDPAVAGERAFKWEDKFPEIFRNGGFDVVVGNPPYIRIQTLEGEQVEFYNSKYLAATKNYDIYVLFVERALHLIKDVGALGFILPAKFFVSDYGEGLRNNVTKNFGIKEIVDFKDFQVFEGAITYTCLLFLTKRKTGTLRYYELVDANKLSQNKLITVPVFQISNQKPPEEGATWNFVKSEYQSIINKLNAVKQTLDACSENIFQGIITGADKIFILSKTKDGFYSDETNKIYNLENELLHPLLKGSKHVRRYYLDPSEKYVIFPYLVCEEKAIAISESELKSKYPQIYAYLLENKTTLQKRDGGKMTGPQWYLFSRNQSLARFGQEKIITPSIAKRSSFIFDPESDFFFVGSGGGGGGAYGITLKDKKLYWYVLSILNSRLVSFFISQTSSKFSGGFFAFNRQYIDKIPIIIADNAVKLKLEALATLQQKNYKRLVNILSSASNEVEMLKSEILKIDAEIDQLVYELYDLNAEEIKVVEESIKR